MPIWREEEVREVSSHVTCHATLVSFQPKERSCAEAEAKKEVHSLLSLGGINAQKVGHLASEIGVGIPKKSNEIFCGSSKRQRRRQNATSPAEAFFAFLCPIIIWWQQKQSALAGCCFLEAFQSSEAPLSFCLGIFELQTRKKKKKQPLLLLMRNLARLLLFPTYNDFRFQNQQQPEDNPYSQPVKLKRREVSTETGTLPNWTRTYYDFFLFELTTTKILRNIKIVVAHATWPAVGRIGCAGLPRPIWSKLDADVSVVLTPIIYLHRFLWDP